jgi:DNA replication and repair protein RecF
LELIEKSRGKKPIFLLDDVFSELDGARRHALVEYLKNNQTIITTTDADAIIEHFTDANNILAL